MWDPSEAEKCTAFGRSKFDMPGGKNMMCALGDLLSQSQYSVPTATNVGTGVEMISYGFARARKQRDGNGTGHVSRGIINTSRSRCLCYSFFSSGCDFFSTILGYLISHDHLSSTGSPVIYLCC